MAILKRHNRLRHSTPAGFRWLSLAIVLGMLMSTGTALRAQPPGSPEYLLKAAFLYNIAKFVEWPPAALSTSNTPMTVCVVGDAFGTAIETVEGKQVQGHPLTVKQDPSVNAAKDCHLLFVSETELGKSAALLAAVKGGPVLTVCDSARCTERGFMVNLQLTDNKVGLEINMDTVQLAPIKISSQLMKLARLVSHNR